MTTHIFRLLAEIEKHPDCTVLPAAGTAPLDLPADAQEFYRFCGGIEFHTSSEYVYRILPPNELCPFDPEEEMYEHCFCDGNPISLSWYVIASNWNSEKIAIDTHMERSGRCYDLYLGNDFQVIADSFTELVERLFKSNGHYTYWLQEEFPKVDPCSI